jgi:hypothetical protein
MNYSTPGRINVPILFPFMTTDYSNIRKCKTTRFNKSLRVLPGRLIQDVKKVDYHQLLFIQPQRILNIAWSHYEIEVTPQQNFDLHHA